MHNATTHDKWRVSQGELRQGNFSKLHCGLKFYIPLAFVAIKSFLANGWRWRDWGCLGEKDKVKDREVNWCVQTLGMSITSASMIAQILLSKHVEGRLEEIRSPSCSLAYTVGVCQPACMLLPRIYSGCLSGCLYVCLLYGIVAASRIYEQDSLFFSYFLPLSGVYIR